MWPQGHPRKPYPSDVTDQQWALLEPLIPPSRTQRGGRPREVDMREVINTILYQNRSGCQWDMLPHDLLPKSTVYDEWHEVKLQDTAISMLRVPLSLVGIAASNLGPTRDGVGCNLFRSNRQKAYPRRILSNY
jgi:hypothetical protein